MEWVTSPKGKVLQKKEEKLRALRYLDWASRLEGSAHQTVI